MFTLGWVLVLLHHASLISLAGAVPLGLHGLYSLAGATGWVSGNVYLRLRAGLAASRRRSFAATLLFGPAFLPALVRAMAPAAWQQEAPLVPLYCLGVTAIFFFVPVSLAPRAPEPPRAG